MNQHTPGPWHVIADEQSINVASGPQGVLEYVSTAGARGRTLAEAQANARLIAAAPDLLKGAQAAWHALHSLMATRHGIGDEVVMDVITCLKKGIDKAQGKE